MKLTFGWYGDDDPVTLSHIRQIPQMTGIVSAIYDTPVGEVWSRESIAAMKKKGWLCGLNHPAWSRQSTEEGNGITEDCIKYLAPLILGEVFPKYENGLPKHIVI